jgi:enoyl-CoA hydratase
MRGELHHGMAALAEAQQGAARFTGGAGRHGSFADL